MSCWLSTYILATKKIVCSRNQLCTALKYFIKHSYAAITLSVSNNDQQLVSDLRSDQQ